MRFVSVVRAVLACSLLSLAACSGLVYAQSSYPSIQAWIGTLNPIAGGSYPATVGPASDVAGMVAATAAAVPGPFTWATCNSGAAVRVYASSNSCALYSYSFALVSSCSGSDVLSADGLTCTGAGAPSSLDYSIIGVSAATILLVFSWGMGAVLSMWAIGYAAGVAVAVIKAL